MQIKNLSSLYTHPFGTLLSALPDKDTLFCHHGRYSAAVAQEFCAQAPVILDYVSGMPLLVIYEAETCRCYYLDRLIALRPGVRFSIVALDTTCAVDCYTTGPDPLPVVAEHAAGQFQLLRNELGLERLYTIFYQECTRDFYFRGERHEAMELVYVDRGTLHNVVGGTDLLLRQQQMLLIDRNVWHMQYADLPVSFLTVSFRAEPDSPCAALVGRCMVLSAQQQSWLRQLCAEDGTAACSHDYAESLLRLLMIDLLRSDGAHTLRQSSPLPATCHTEQRLVDQLLQTISASAGKKLTLRQLAASAHISTTYLHRIFQTQLGMPPGAYLTKIRIEESKLLLRSGTISMGEAARQLGFSSQQHFSRQFRSVTGMTPSEYVRTLR